MPCHEDRDSCYGTTDGTVIAHRQRAGGGQSNELLTRAVVVGGFHLGQQPSHRLTPPTVRCSPCWSSSRRSQNRVAAFFLQWSHTGVARLIVAVGMWPAVSHRGSRWLALRERISGGRVTRRSPPGGACVTRPDYRAQRPPSSSSRASNGSTRTFASSRHVPRTYHRAPSRTSASRVRAIGSMSQTCATRSRA